MKWLISVLILVLVGLQYRLWIGEGSFANFIALQKEIVRQEVENGQLLQRNKLLQAEVEALKAGYDAIEEKARYDMGMIKKDETYYLIVEDNNPAGDK